MNTIECLILNNVFNLILIVSFSKEICSQTQMHFHIWWALRKLYSFFFKFKNILYNNIIPIIKKLKKTNLVNALTFFNNHECKQTPFLGTVSDHERIHFYSEHPKHWIITNTLLISLPYWIILSSCILCAVCYAFIQNLI